MRCPPPKPPQPPSHSSSHGAGPRSRPPPALRPAAPLPACALRGAAGRMCGAPIHSRHSLRGRPLLAGPRNSGRVGWGCGGRHRGGLSRGAAAVVDAVEGAGLHAEVVQDDHDLRAAGARPGRWGRGARRRAAGAARPTAGPGRPRQRAEGGKEHLQARGVKEQGQEGLRWEEGLR